MSKVLVEKSDGIVHVRINRPEVMNACDGETYNAIADAWDELENDPDSESGDPERRRSRILCRNRYSNGSSRRMPRVSSIACIHAC